MQKSKQTRLRYRANGQKGNNMTVTFENKYTGELVHHEGVGYFVPDESCFGVSGYGLHFIDNTYCLVSSATYKFVAASVQQ